jgi:hypothetical protein
MPAFPAEDEVTPNDGLAAAGFWFHDSY